MTQDDDMKRKQQGRSPPFPFISLDRAIQRTQELHDYSKGHAIRVQTAMTAWKYNPKSSGGLQTVGALKGYGLIVDIGIGDEKKIQISDLAKRLFMSPPEEIRLRLLAEAALKPKLINEYWHLWGAHRPPDSECRWQLIDKRGFTEDAAAKFLSVYDATVSFSGLRDEDDAISDEETDFSEIFQTEGDEQTPAPSPRGPNQIVKGNEAQKFADFNTSNLRQAVFPLSEGDVTLVFPGNLSAEGYEELGEYLQIFLRKAKREVKADTSKLNPFD